MGAEVLDPLGSEGVVAHPDGLQVVPGLFYEIFEVLVSDSAVAHR